MGQVANRGDLALLQEELATSDGSKAAKHGPMEWADPDREVIKYADDFVVLKGTSETEKQRAVPERVGGSRRRRNVPVCRYFQRSNCKYGDVCKFQHAAAEGNNPEATVCKYWLQGKCRYGDDCFNLHSSPEMVLEQLMMAACLEELSSDDDEDSGYGGFSSSDLEELACQGVKPWDEDAWDVLAALSSY